MSSIILLPSLERTPWQIIFVSLPKDSLQPLPQWLTLYISRRLTAPKEVSRTSLLCSIFASKSILGCFGSSSRRLIPVFTRFMTSFSRRIKSIFHLVNKALYSVYRYAIMPREVSLSCHSIGLEISFTKLSISSVLTGQFFVFQFFPT